MKFTVSTKPLKTGLGLCIVNNNVSDFYQKSTIVQITATRNSLHVNVEAASIKSEIQLKGIGDDEYASILVGSLMFKQLISTLTSPQVDFEFFENCLVVHAAKSTYTIPARGDVSIMQLQKPQDLTDSDIATADELSKSDWRFIKDHQMYAKSKSYTEPVYTYAWVGEQGDVLVSDFANGLFTHSKINPLGKTCLLSDSIINLFQSLPDGAKVISRGDIYSISVTTDGYTFISEFEPKYESEETGNYNAEIIMSLMTADTADSVKVSVSDINMALNQAVLLSIDKEFKVVCTVDKNQIVIVADSTNCVIPIECGPDESYTINFRYTQLKSVMSNCSETTISISPILNNGVVSGLLFDSNALKVALAGVK